MIVIVLVLIVIILLVIKFFSGPGPGGKSGGVGRPNEFEEQELFDMM